MEKPVTQNQLKLEYKGVGTRLTAKFPNFEIREKEKSQIQIKVWRQKETYQEKVKAEAQKCCWITQIACKGDVEE